MINNKPVFFKLGLIFLLILFSACQQTVPNLGNRNNHEQSYDGYLSVLNGDIVDEKQKVIQFRGFNVSGWLLNENWINPGFIVLGGDEHEYRIRSFLDSKYGPLNMGKLFTNEFRNRFITKSDFEYWKSLGANVLRLNVSHLLLLEGESGFEYIDNAVNWSEELGLYIIIDLITVPGCANTLDYCDINKEANLWADIGNFNELQNLWLTIAARYKDRSAVAGYNLINEPNSSTHELLKETYRRLIAAIRTIDQKHIIFLDGNNYAANFEVFADGSLAAMDANLVYSFHLYSGSNCSPLINWKKSILDFIDGPIFNKVSNQKVPIWLGEYAGDCPAWINVVHGILNEKGVAHTSYYSPKCAGGTYKNSKCLSKMKNTDSWKNLLINAKDGILSSNWITNTGFDQLDHINFEYDQEKINALFYWHRISAE